MQKQERLYEILYISTLAPGSPIKVVSQIAGAARTANKARNITGLLLFDGMRFCQQLEGPQKEVLALFERIRVDTRHVNVEILHNYTLEARRFKNFSLAYTSVDDVEQLATLEKLDGQPAMAQFLAIIADVDMDG
jgi:Sensors of blue-light using FAD